MTPETPRWAVWDPMVELMDRATQLGGRDLEGIWPECSEYCICTFFRKTAKCIHTCMVPFYYNLSHFSLVSTGESWHIFHLQTPLPLRCPGVLCSCRCGGATYGPSGAVFGNRVV